MSISTIVSILALLQGFFLISVPFFEKTTVACTESKFHQVAKYLFIILGVVTILFAIASLYKLIKIPLRWFCAIIFLLQLIAVTIHALDFKCDNVYLLIEELVFLAIILVLLAWAFWSDRKTRIL